MGGVEEREYAPAITIANWENNHGIIEYEGDKDQSEYEEGMARML